MRRIAVISEHALLRQGVVQLLKESGFAPTQAATHADLRATPEAIILDLDHTPEDAQKLLVDLNAQFPDTLTIVVGNAQRLAASSDGVAHVELEAMRATAPALVATLRHRRTPVPSPQLARAHRRWASVTPRQREVLRWLAIGLDNRAIAAELKVTARAIKAHVSALLVTFGLESRTDLALLAQAAGARPPVRSAVR